MALHLGGQKIAVLVWQIFGIRDNVRDFDTNKHAFSFELSMQAIHSIKVELGVELSSVQVWLLKLEDRKARF